MVQESRTIWSWTIRTLWSWTINNLEEYSKSYMLLDNTNQHCSRSMFAICSWSMYAFQILFKYAPGPYLKSTLLQEHVCYMLLEQYAFQIWSWSIFNLEYFSRLLMVQDHKVLMVLDHTIRTKSHKSGTVVNSISFREWM